MEIAYYLVPFVGKKYKSVSFVQPLVFHGAIIFLRTGILYLSKMRIAHVHVFTGQ
jgi:hypothetical protein